MVDYFIPRRTLDSLESLTEMVVLQKTPFANISDIYVNWEEGLLGITLDDKFTENHFVYAFYNYKDESTGEIHGRVVRFTDKDSIGSDLRIIIDKIPSSRGFHTGGALQFNKKDDKLYVSVGDATLGEPAQNTSLLYGKILRYNRDGTIPQN